MFYPILCTDNSGNIGINNSLPWNYKSEMNFFNKITTFTPIDTLQNIVIMGHNTFKSINKILKNRINIVISSQDIPNQPNLYFVKSFHQAIILSKSFKSFKTFVIGGLKTYIQAFSHPECNTIYINIIQKTFNADTKINLDLFDITPYDIIIDNNTEITLNKATIRHDEFNYLKLLNNTIHFGNKRNTRNGFTYSLFSQDISFDLTKGFPLLTTKKMFWKGIVEELLFFIRGHTNSKLLEDKGVNIWKWNTTKQFIQDMKLPYEEGDMGNMYGFQWRHFGTDYIDCHTDYTNKGFDQLNKIIQEIKTNPTSRRIIMTDFDPSKAHQGVLYPCHSIVLQFYVQDELLSVKMYQRSIDVALGLPFNIASTSLLLHIIAKLTNKIPYKVILSLGDVHIYDSHFDLFKSQLTKEPFPFPNISIPDFTTIEQVENSQFNDYKLINYVSHEPIKAKMVA